MGSTLSESLAPLNRATGVVWLIHFLISLFLLFYLLPIPMLIGVFAAIYLRRAPSTMDANIGGAFALGIGALTGGLFAVLPGQQAGFALVSALSFGVALYTVAAAAIAAQRVTFSNADLPRTMSLAAARACVRIAAQALCGAALLILISSCGGKQIHASATLPDHFTACGRTWIKDVLERTQSLDGIRHMIGVEPVFVDPGPLTACPDGACTAVAQDGPCHTVIYVRVGEDAYLGYELSGGP
jgi:hypothetical protein